MSRKKNKRYAIAVVVICLLMAVIGFRKMETCLFGFRLEVVQVADGGYGYKIYEGRRPVIYQPFIPDVSGKKSFKTPKEAKKVARLVINRIRHGENFSVSENDLKQLDIDME